MVSILTTLFLENLSGYNCKTFFILITKRHSNQISICFLCNYNKTAAERVKTIICSQNDMRQGFRP